MRVFANTAPGRMEWLDRPTPEPGPGQVRIRTRAVGICATDLHMIAGWARTGHPAVPGHEWSGVVEAAGAGVDPALIGRACVAENVLADGGEVGFEHWGGYGECILNEARNVRLLPDGVDAATAALIEPLAVCVRAANRLTTVGADLTAPCLVLGDGPIGLLMLHVLRHRGAKELALVGGRSSRLEVAAALGAGRTADYHALLAAQPAQAENPLLTALLDWAGPARWPVVVEVSGSGAAMAAALDLATPRGCALVVGDYGASRADFPWNKVLHRELVVAGSNASAGGWDEAVALAGCDPATLSRLATHRMGIDRFDEAIRLTREDRTLIKAVVEWP